MGTAPATEAGGNGVTRVAARATAPAQPMFSRIAWSSLPSFFRRSEPLSAPLDVPSPKQKQDRLPSCGDRPRYWLPAPPEAPIFRARLLASTVKSDQPSTDHINTRRRGRVSPI